MDPGPSSSVLTDFREARPHDQPQYDEAFPALPPNPSGPNSGPTSGLSSPGANNKWSQKMRIGSNTVTSVFHIPFEERSDRGHGERFGEMDALKACGEIIKQSGAHIELSSSSRDQSLTFLVTGKQSSVVEAKREILQRFQTQAQKQINIPKEHHRFILGKQGQKLNELEKTTATKISIPRPNDDSNMITIVGPKEGIEKAEHEIRWISDEQSKQASERISVPKKFHPFILGPFGEKVGSLIAVTGARINIPPVSVMNDEISVVGEKEGVAKAVQAIKNDLEVFKKYVTVSVEVRKTQHKYIIGKQRITINEILRETGVSVEIPPLESPSETISLHGPAEILGSALTVVYEKANSIITRTVDAPAWVHKHVIGKKGCNIQKITSSYPRAHVEIMDSQNQIVIEGPPEDVEPVTLQLQECVKNLIDNMSFKDISVDPKYYKHIIGKNGTNINRLKDDTGVIISVQDAQSSGQMANIHLEGTRVGVEQASKHILDQVNKLESEKEKDLIIEHRFHGNLIGAKGAGIREIREKFNQVQINFPTPDERRDVVTVRGPKDDVDKCCSYMTKLYKEMVENSFQLKVPIFPQCYRLVVGKGGANIRKIREETNTRFDLPPLAEGKSKTEAEIIVITGRKENCEAARDRLLSLQNSVADVVEIDVMIPSKFHNSLIGVGGKVIQSISDDCGGVHIKFPDSKTKSDRVQVMGPKDMVEKAKNILVDLSKDKEISGHVEILIAKPQHHKFLIGKSGANIKKIRESTNARIVFPGSSEGNQEAITIIGKKENVANAKQQLMDIIKDLEKTVESEMTVDPQYHRHFVLRRGEILRQIADEFGGVSVSFPKVGSNSSKVIIKGPPECVDAAKQRISSIADDLSKRVNIDVVIEQKHHRTIMGSQGSKVKQIQSDHNVDIKFPERPDDHDEEHIPEQNGDGARASDIIRVSGRPENCEAAKNALLEQVPIIIEVDIPFKMHRHVIGQKGKDVRELMKIHDVHIQVPAPPKQDEQGQQDRPPSDTIKILGSPKNCAAAKEALLNLKEDLEGMERDREARSFIVRVQVDPEFHPKIIGKQGAVIGKIRDQFNVNIQLPRRDSEEQDVIVITGYEADANNAKEEILGIVNELVQREKFREEVEIDHRVHSRIIGQRGKTVRQIMKDFNVDIRFPRSESGNPNLVVISGGEQDKVYDARDHLLNMEEEYIQDVTENEYMQKYLKKDSDQNQGNHKQKQSNGFVVKGAPWNAPDTQSTVDFPTFGNGLASAETEPMPVAAAPVAPAPRPLNSAWGARKHF
ncbi:vigilin isoform X2 [Folsomia candida]|uniref:vigilin isoform X2 n=1 Tax=Folsomia candida TaxID=158441 RepID=UPI000B9038EE|nr:vigilin isoform X2 [Folsomia candida]